MKKESMVARRLVKDHMLSNELLPHTLNITNALMISGKSARLKYQSHQDELKESLNKDEDHNARKIVNDEINEAEFQQDMSLVVKVNALKRKSTEKKEDIKKLEEVLDILEKKKKLL